MGLLAGIFTPRRAFLWQMIALPTLRCKGYLACLETSRPATRYIQQGLTLLDLLVVVLILGIVGAIAVPQFHSMMIETRLNEATGEVVAGLQYARNLAVKHQRPFGLKAAVGGNWFRVFDCQYKDDPNPHHDYIPPVDANGVVHNPVDKKWYTKDFDTMQTYHGVTITSVPAGEAVSFYPDGHSSYSDNTFVLSYGEDQRTITVKGTTGRISVQ